MLDSLLSSLVLESMNIVDSKFLSALSYLLSVWYQWHLQNSGLSVGDDITHRPCVLPSFLTGQRLFRRSGESFSETSSIGQVEETTREGHITQQSSDNHPPTPPPAPEEDSHSASDAVPETIQESSVQVQTQVEAGVASEERQLEGQEVEHSGR